MKRVYLVFIILFLTCFYSYSQSISYRAARSKDLVYIFNNIEKMADSVYRSNDGGYLFVRVYRVGDPSGSAGNESSEITHSIYIATSEDGEYPKQNLFKLSSVYSPKFIGWSMDKNSQPLIKLEYGPYDELKMSVITVYLNRLSINTTLKANE